MKNHQPQPVKFQGKEFKPYFLAGPKPEVKYQKAFFDFIALYAAYCGRGYNTQDAYFIALGAACTSSGIPCTHMGFQDLLMILFSSDAYIDTITAEVHGWQGSPVRVYWLISDRYPTVVCR